MLHFLHCPVPTHRYDSCLCIIKPLWKQTTFSSMDGILLCAATHPLRRPFTNSLYMSFISPLHNIRWFLSRGNVHMTSTLRGKGNNIFGQVVRLSWYKSTNLQQSLGLNFRDLVILCDLNPHSLMFFGATVLRNGTGYSVLFQIFNIIP